MCSNITYHALIRVNVNQDNGFRWLFWGRGVVVCVIQTQHPEDALRTPWATPSFAMQRALQEECRRPIRQWAGCARFEQTHTQTMWLRILFHGEVLGILEKYCVILRIFFSSWLEHHSLKHGVVAAVAVKKRWAAHAKWDQIQLKPLPTHALFTSRQTSLSIHSIRQTVWWVSQQASPWK